MTECKFLSSEIIPIYHSTVVSKNDDDTYEVRHIFVDDNGCKIFVKYPKVKITIDATIDPFGFPRAFPYSNCQVLPFGENDELLTLTIE